jgi:hypothetical protein
MINKLQQMLEEALANIASMTVDDFEAECIKAGYTPERKKTNLRGKLVMCKQYWLI